MTGQPQRKAYAVVEQSRLERARERARRRPRPRREFDTTVPSPCITVCQIDDTTGLCLGCARNVDEIREWPILTAEEKKQILEHIRERKSAAS